MIGRYEIHPGGAPPLFEFVVAFLLLLFLFFLFCFCAGGWRGAMVEQGSTELTIPVIETTWETRDPEVQL